MEGFKQNVATVMAFLKTNSFSHSVISLHKCCYEDLQRYLFRSPCLQAKKNAVLLSSDQLMAFRWSVLPSASPRYTVSSSG